MNVLPEIIVHSHFQMTLVLRLVVVRVADKRGLEVIVDLRITDGHEVAGMREIDETVVEVFAVVLVGGEVYVVDPDICGFLRADGVAVLGEDFGDLDVTNDDVLLAAHEETDAYQF